MNITLVSIHIENSARAVPLGPAMLASVVKKKFSGKVITKILNLYLAQSVDECVEAILATKSRYIGFSLFIWNRTKSLEIIRKLKKTDPDLVVFLGGAEATGDYENLIKLEEIDAVLRGEGEEVIVKYVDEIMNNNNDLPSIDPIIPKLDALPSPFLDGTLDPDGYSGLLWELSRGCPFKCDFCFESRGTSGVRRFSPERIQAELELFKEHDIDQIFVLDPTFNYNPDTAKEILNQLIQADTNIHFCMEIRAEFLDSEMAELFSGISCSLQIGLQSSDPAVLKNINRSLNPEKFADKILLLHQNGVVYGFDLIYGLPGDTLAGFMQSLDFSMSLAPNHLDLFPLSVLPGTKLWDTADSFGLKYLKESPYTVESTPEFSENDMKKARKVATACDLFYNKGKAVPWFSIVLNSLEIPPSEFFNEFAIWLDENEHDIEDIVKIQTDFLKHIFSKAKQNLQLGLIASDVVSYFGKLAILFQTEFAFPENMPENSRYLLNPVSSFEQFSFDPIELIQQIYQGLTSLDGLTDTIQTEENESFLVFLGDDVDLYSFSDEEIKILKSFANGQANLPEDPVDQQFVISCIEEGLILEIE